MMNMQLVRELAVSQSTPVDGDLYIIRLGRMVCGVIVVPGRYQPMVTTTAPIMKWSRGESLATLKKWVKSKGGTVTLYTEPLSENEQKIKDNGCLIGECGMSGESCLHI